MNQKLKEIEEEEIIGKFTMSQTFSEKFAPRIEKINQLKHQKVEQLAGEKDKRMEKIQI